MVRMYHSLLNHSPVEGPLDYFQFGAIMNKAAINIHVKFFFGENKSLFFGINAVFGNA